MYLGSALKLAIPFAILDREDYARVYEFRGPQAREAEVACNDMRAIAGIKPSRLSAEQRETARLALCWAEQYLFGYLDALAGSNKAEARMSTNQLNLIRKARLEHFGATENEVAIARCIAVPIGGVGDIDSLMKMLSNVVVCPSCNTRTNGRSAGDACNTCTNGIFQKP
nr:hypothetical protein [Comamonas testosteroni]